MLFLSPTEKTYWAELGREALDRSAKPGALGTDVRANLRPIFHFYIGTLLTAKGLNDIGREWINTGTMIEEDGLFSNAFLTGFLKRQQGRLIMPEQVFADPRHYVHFTTTPAIRQSRENFLKHCGHSLPKISRPFRIMDIGCGDGGLMVALLKHLQAVAKIGDIGEILLIDPSPGMIALARETAGKVFPPAAIKTLNSRIEGVSGQITRHYDAALCSLAYHHMPYETKVVHLQKLKPHIDHLLLFELDANNDLPELHTPELVVSVCQSYGRMIDFVFSHDAPVAVAQACVDKFLMTEEVSLLTQPRGQRNDYHMLKSQWLGLFEQVLAPDFQCYCDSPCYADEYLSLFTLHYGRA